MKIENLDPADLRVHPILKGVPELAKDSAEFLRLCESVLECGRVLEPLQVTAAGEIVDGRHRWRAAKAAQLIEVPCVVIEDSEVLRLALTSLTQRRHYTKGALAYLAFPLLQGAVDEAKARQLSALKSGKTPHFSRSPLSGLRAWTVQELAESIGVGRSFFFQAKEVHGLFEAEEAKAATAGKSGNMPSLRAQWEPKILSGEVGLGAAVAGIRGGQATAGKPRGKHEQLELWSDGLKTLVLRTRGWAQWSEADRTAASEQLRGAAAAMDLEARNAWRRALNWAKKHGAMPDSQ